MGKNRPDANDQRTVTGVVRDFNLSPKGAFEGVLLDTDDGVIQVNFPPTHSPHGMSPGRSVGMVIGPDHNTLGHPPGAHPVYCLVAVRGGKDSTVPTRVTGTVRRLNYARHGEPNGVVLDTGDFIYLEPDEMKRVGLVVGQRIEAEGDARPTATGGRVIEASAVNGSAVARGEKHPA